MRSSAGDGPLLSNIVIWLPSGETTAGGYSPSFTGFLVSYNGTAHRAGVELSASKPSTSSLSLPGNQLIAETEKPCDGAGSNIVSPAPTRCTVIPDGLAYATSVPSGESADAVTASSGAKLVRRTRRSGIGDGERRYANQTAPPVASTAATATRAIRNAARPVRRG